MIKNKFKFKWHSFIRAHHLDEETVFLMKESGCKLVYLGLESGSQKILNNMKKKATIEKYSYGLKLLNEYEIPSVASFIIGFPGETYKTYLETCNFIEENKPTFFRRCVWFYDHEAPIHKEKDLYKIEGDGFQWKHATMDASAAHKLANNMFFHIKNSVFDSDFPFSFHLNQRDFDFKTIRNFLNDFNLGVIDRLRNWDLKEYPQKLEEKLLSIIK